MISIGETELAELKGADIMIAEFRGAYAFLSNFHPAPTPIDNLVYPTSEHAFQAMKSTDPAYRMHVLRAPTPGQAKRLGRAAALRVDWEAVKIDVMREVVRAKFRHNADLAAQLLATGDQELVEGNVWGDKFWGVCNGRGHNWLGKILMEVRAELRGRT